jgi:hypothetical protein
MICAKALAVGPGKSFSLYIGQGDFENDCNRGTTDNLIFGHDLLVTFLYDLLCTKTQQYDYLHCS